MKIFVHKNRLVLKFFIFYTTLLLCLYTSIPVSCESVLNTSERYQNFHPFIWNPGPQFATLFRPYELILYASDPQNDTLSFDVKIGGWSMRGISTDNFLEPLPFDQDDPYAPYTCARAALRFTPQVPENLIITVTVSDQYTSDVTVFPLSVVNFPIANYPPIIQRGGTASNWLAYVGEPLSYQFKVFDQDYDQLTYSATIAGLPNYQYGPWQEALIDPHTGLMEITPYCEGIFPVRVIVRDEKGAFSVSDRNLYVINKGT